MKDQIIRDIKYQKALKFASLNTSTFNVYYTETEEDRAERYAKEYDEQAVLHFLNKETKEDYIQYREEHSDEDGISVELLDETKEMILNGAWDDRWVTSNGEDTPAGAIEVTIK